MGEVAMERPDWSAIGAMVSDLRRSLDNVGDTQRRLTKVTGTAWSEDRMVKAVVGPRGHLVELELDPRIYRRPNSKALAATIVATVRSAVEDVLRQTKEILDDMLPSDMRLGVVDTKLAKLIQRHDADVLAEEDEGDE
jgi:DNA-binding protein YbaB